MIKQVKEEEAVMEILKLKFQCVEFRGTLVEQTWQKLNIIFISIFYLVYNPHGNWNSLEWALYIYTGSRSSSTEPAMLNRHVQ